MKILIIEDEPALRELIQRSLEKERYVVEVASGKKVCAEISGFHDMAIFKQGVTL